VPLFQVILQYLFFYWAMTTLSGVLSSILNATGSFWWVLFAPIFKVGEKASRKQFLFIVTGFIGVVVCVLSRGGVDNFILGGTVLMLLSTLSGTGSAMLVKPLSGKLPIKFVTGFALFTGGLVLTIFCPLESYQLYSNAPVELYLITFHLAMVSALAFSVWYHLISKFDVPTLSAYRFLIPICGATESIIFLPGESLSLQIIAGGLLVICSIILIEREKRLKKPSGI
jgi:drug/metabolite transporter (DMT)-like permease